MAYDPVADAVSWATALAFLEESFESKKLDSR
jgi:hypothetical protein